MKTEITIEQLQIAIKKLSSDPPKTQPGIWYKTQKEHWLGWLKEYRGPGAYRRKGGSAREAKFAYNHVVNYHMLTWIIDAAGVDPKLVRQAKAAVNDKKTLQANARVIRGIVPWEILADALWGNTQ